MSSGRIHKNYILFHKHVQGTWKHPLHIYSDVWDLQEQLGIEIRKRMDRKLEKCEASVYGFELVFYKWEKQSMHA